MVEVVFMMDSDGLELNDKFREELNKLFSDENWSKLYETYVMFGKEEAELLFTEQITEIFPELKGKIEGKLFNTKRGFDSFDDVLKKKK